VYPGNATNNQRVLDWITRFIWTFTLRSYNYSSHNLAPHKLMTSSSLLYSVWLLNSVLPFLADGTSVSVLVDECSLVTPSFLTCLQSTSNPLKMVLRVPSREHLVEQLNFPFVTQMTLVAITEGHIPVVWQWTLVVM
jgi:hypothetical protein